MIGALDDGGFGFGLLMAAFWFGFRHGIDWDHIAAITDITGTQDERRRSLLYGTLYAVGHAVVVLALGLLAIAAGDRLPDGVDDVMTRIVGVTLVLLGVYVFVSLIRHGRDFRLRSRWMLVFAGVRRGARWARERVRVGGNGPEESRDVDASLWHHGHHGRPGHHHHEHPERDEAFMSYSRSTAFTVGMIHGIGAETPTQVVIFLAAAGAAGAGVGILVLTAFIVGLLASNTLITLGSAFGFLQATKNFPLYATVAVITAVFSLVIGTLFLLGKDALLPAFFGG